MASVPDGFEMSWLIMTSGGGRSLVFTHEETQKRVHCSCSHSKKVKKQPKTNLSKVISGAGIYLHYVVDRTETNKM